MHLNFYCIVFRINYFDILTTLKMMLVIILLVIEKKNDTI